MVDGLLAWNGDCKSSLGDQTKKVGKGRSSEGVRAKGIGSFSEREWRKRHKGETRGNLECDGDYPFRFPHLSLKNSNVTNLCQGHVKSQRAKGGADRQSSHS